MRGAKKLHHLNMVSRLFLLCLCSFFLFFLTACSLKQRTDDKRESVFIQPENNSYFNEMEFVRMLAFAHNSNISPDVLWESLPLKQRSTISMDDFSAYIVRLRKIIPEDVTSVYEADPEMLEKMLLNLNSLKLKKHKMPPHFSCWYLSSDIKGKRSESFPVLVALDENNCPYFSQDILQSESELYDYIELYLDAVKNEDVPCLAGLLHNASEAKLYGKIYEEKLARIQKFYRTITKNSNINSTFEILAPGYAQVRQIYTVNGGYQNRTVEFSFADDKLKVREPIAEKPRAEDTAVVGDDFVINTGEDSFLSSDSEFTEHFGKPLNIVALMGSDSVEDPNILSSNNAKYKVVFRGVTFYCQGRFDTIHKAFSGYVYGFTLQKGNFTTTSGLKVGDDLEEVFRRYAFAKENNYRLEAVDEERSKTLYIEQDGKTITAISFFDLEKPR